MEENKIKLKSINDLLSYKFFIPSYQRGYRWDQRQIIELLEDINEFKDNKKDREFYCLQPVIVKKEGDYYKLIDGQQRLTTIYIILSYLNRKKFAIQFETRERSKEFLENLSDEINEENIDFYHISHAYRYIKEWFKEKEDDEATIADEFYINLGKYTKVIWYEIAADEVEIDVFTRINSGKIELTEAELIKALFLNGRNFTEDEKHLRQIEIAKEWDEIEFTLQNNELWYFLNKYQDYPTRIKLVFDIFSEEAKDSRDTSYQYLSKQDDIVKLWAEEDENIKKVFLSLKHWYENRELYHLIGYLVASEKLSVNEIYQLFKSMRKHEFKRELYDRIKNEFDINTLGELDYNYEKSKVFRALLLFNIATILNNRNSYIRFAYDKFNKENWSIEHIHAQQDKGFTRSDAIKKWLEDVNQQINRIKLGSKKSEKNKIKKEIIDEINDLLQQEKIKGEDERFLSIQTKVFEFFGDEPDINTIDNLALLSGQVNSSLSNNIFPIKREILITKDKLGEFVPICTKNVFLKYYSSKVDNLYFWNQDDRKDYLKEVKNVIKSFGE
ncbi:MAG: DUF262 domain-containing protein [Bacteroidales bacterium]|nr:DUF262 domain-containing protein [Bacteroidales bacterium]